MPKEVKFNEEELKTIKEIQQSYLGVQNSFGQEGDATNEQVGK